jgi:hypothetical protein
MKMMSVDSARLTNTAKETTKRRISSWGWQDRTGFETTERHLEGEPELQVSVNDKLGVELP